MVMLGTWLLSQQIMTSTNDLGLLPFLNRQISWESEFEEQQSDHGASVVKVKCWNGESAAREGWGKRKCVQN